MFTMRYEYGANPMQIGSAVVSSLFNRRKIVSTMGGVVAFTSLLSFGCAVMMRFNVQLLPASDRAGALEFINLTLVHCPGIFAEALVIAILLGLQWTNTAWVCFAARASILLLGVSVLSFCIHCSYSLPSTVGRVDFVGRREAFLFAEFAPYVVAIIVVPMLFWALYVVNGPSLRRTR